MSLKTKKILCLTDDPKVKAFLQDALSSQVKFVVFAISDADAVSKTKNSEFDLVILRTLKPTLDDVKKFFQWSKVQKDTKNLPWIVLGKDIESDQHLVDHRNLKFLENPSDGPGLLKMMEGLLFTPTSGTPVIDVNFINPFVNAVSSVLETMGQVKITRGTPYVKKPGDNQSATGDISGIIAMNSDRFVGSMAICYQEGLILRIYNNMMGEVVRAINDDVKDAVAETTNVIFGNAKRDLNLIGHTIQPAIPSVITGKNHEIRHSVDGVRLVIPFECESGKMLIECVMRAK